MMNKVSKGIKNPSKAYRYLRNKYGYKALQYKLVKRWFMIKYDHTEGYRRLMQYRINHFGPERAVGGFDQGIGKLQFDFLRDEGLAPTNSLLDIGCGTLRGGRYYIDYLNEGKYTGMDISSEAIEAGVNRLDKLVAKKDPTFVVNNDLKFEDNNLTESYDYAIAQSVFTHIPAEQIDECLSNIGNVVDGMFYATFFEETKSDPKNFGYSCDTLVHMAEQHGHATELVSKNDFPHPRGQRMMKFIIRK
jgi:SAM-dependent methyltransferase